MPRVVQAVTRQVSGLESLEALIRQLEQLLQVPEIA